MAALLFSKQAKTMTGPLFFLSSRLRQLSSSFIQTLTLFSDISSRRSLTYTVPRAGTLIPVPRLVQSPKLCKVMIKFCCTGRGEELPLSDDGHEEVISWEAYAAGLEDEDPLPGNCLYGSECRIEKILEGCGIMEPLTKYIAKVAHAAAAEAACAPLAIAACDAVADAVRAATVRGDFDFSEDDLASDESKWKLYERWCIHFNVRRNPAEKKQRFDIFKQTLRDIHIINRAEHYGKYGLCEYSDMNEDDNPRISEFGSKLEDVLRNYGFLEYPLGKHIAKVAHAAAFALARQESALDRMKWKPDTDLRELMERASRGVRKEF